MLILLKRKKFRNGNGKGFETWRRLTNLVSPDRISLISISLDVATNRSVLLEARARLDEPSGHVGQTRRVRG